MKNLFDFSQLKAAVAAEIAFQRALEKDQLQQSDTELRKLGLALFPLEVTDYTTNSSSDVLQFRTSFVINDTYFKRGSKILLHIAGQEITGLINELSAQNGTIILSKSLEENPLEHPLRITYLADDATFKCMELGVRLAEVSPLLQQFQMHFHTEKTECFFEHPGLNPSQSKVVGAILSSEPTTVIQGPPGTGKSHTLAIAIQELVKRGKQVVIAAPSNTAVDQLCIKLIPLGVRFLRLGNEEKMNDLVLPYTVDGYLEKGTLARSIQQLEKSMRQAAQIMDRHTRNYTKEAADEKRNARKEFIQLRKEIRQLKRHSEADLIASTPVIAGTPVGLFKALSKEFLADVVILDEAGQALEPLSWLAASFGKQLVLCGDPQQLPPVVMSDEAKKLQLGKSLLERITELVPPLLLNLQYRMAPEIVGSINAHFYHNQLHTSPEIIAGMIQFIDMAGYGEGEEIDEISGSISNKHEVEAIQKLILLHVLSPKTTVILSPYSAQIGALQKALGGSWNVSTIDAIQGQEAENILISLTRSNESQTIGFLSDYRRTNVAISRAKKKCFIIGDSATLGAYSYYSSLISYFEENGNYQSVWEFI